LARKIKKYEAVNKKLGKENKKNTKLLTKKFGKENKKYEAVNK